MNNEELDLTDVAEEALHAAFTVMQDKLNVETGDFAQAWRLPETWDYVTDWFTDYMKAELKQQR